MVAAATLCALLLVLAPRASADTVSVTRFGEEGSNVNGLREPAGIAVSSDGTRVFLADTENNRIDEYTAGGHFVRAWGWGVGADGAAELETCIGPPEEGEGEEEEGEEEVTRECSRGLAGPGEGQLNEPLGVAVSPDGSTVYAINQAKRDGRIESFDITGEEVTFAGDLPAAFGKKGNGLADLTYPLAPTNDLAVDSKGRVYVLDNGESGARVFVFSPARKLLKTIKARFSSATAITVGPDDLIYLGERGGNVEVIDPSGATPSRELYTGVFFGITAIAVMPGSGNLLVEPNTIDSETSTIELVETTPEGERLRGIPVEATRPPSFSKPNPFGLAINPTFQYEDESGRTYEPGVIYFVDRYGNSVNVLAEQTPAKPLIERTSFEAGVEGVTLTATVAPVGADTHVFFEYGATPLYGFASPTQPGIDIGEGFEGETVSVHVYGLQPGTTYHYAVVATNAFGSEVSEDVTFSTYPVGGTLALPDGRAWEQVTTEKGTHDVRGDFAAPGGNGVAFTSAAPLPGSGSGSLYSGYVALRGAGGWRTETATPPVESALGATFLVSSDLSQSVGVSEKNLTGNAPAGNNLYLRDNATGAETLMTPYARTPNGRSFEPIGASADFSRIFFTAGTPLTADTPEGISSALYEWSGGVVRNVGILPGATTPTKALVEARSYTRPSHAVSEDGSRVVFTTEPAPKVEGETNANQVFVRIDGNRTVEASASQAEVPDEGAAQQNAKFVGAAADGSAVFFKSSARLTDDADTGSEGGEAVDREPNLYRYDVDTGELLDLTVSEDPADEELGAAATGGVLVADGGKSAYFVARGDLAPGGVSGGYNLYRWTLSGGVSFVASLEGNDFLSQENGGEEAATTSARTTADGSVLMFTSKTALDPAFPGVRETKEIYRYVAGGGAPSCISCTHTSNSQSPATIAERSGLAPNYEGNVLSPDGSRFFFQTATPLVPQDTNGLNDVYEWENGSTYLISSGSGDSGASLVDSSVTGDDVFFTTDQQLVPGDQDGYVDIYDAKVGGGLPGPAGVAPPCEGTSCRSSSTAAPSTSIGSRSFNGPANPKKKHHRKKHHKKKHHKHRKHAKHRKHKRSHGHPAVGKRG